MGKFNEEFPDFPADAWPEVPHPSFVDTSWRNDACPTITSDELGLTIWIDYPDPADRDCNVNGKRFSVTRQNSGVEMSPEPGVAYPETDDWAEVVAFVAARAKPPAPRIKFTCPSCGSANVRCDASGAWNVEAQAWELADTYDNCWCADCEAETKELNREEA